MQWLVVEIKIVRLSCKRMLDKAYGCNSQNLYKMKLLGLGKIEKNLTEEAIFEFQPKDGGVIAKEVYSVTVKSRYEPTLGNIKKLVNIKSNKIVGIVLRN